MFLCDRAGTNIGYSGLALLLLDLDSTSRFKRIRALLNKLPFEIQLAPTENNLEGTLHISYAFRKPCLACRTPRAMVNFPAF